MASHILKAAFLNEVIRLSLLNKSSAIWILHARCQICLGKTDGYEMHAGVIRGDFYLLRTR